ncbi:hypothetical protein BX070DRAFT_227343 [Coemansia spiralis]|nr:hypothetical protein BX070DRAFT_227343 [Coemansia spiralis]
MWMLLFWFFGGKLSDFFFFAALPAGNGPVPLNRIAGQIANIGIGSQAGFCFFQLPLTTPLLDECCYCYFCSLVLAITVVTKAHHATYLLAVWMATATNKPISWQLGGNRSSDNGARGTSRPKAVISK